MRIDHDEDAFLGAEAMVVFPVAPGSSDPRDEPQHEWEEDEPAEAEATLRDAIRALLQLRHG